MKTASSLALVLALLSPMHAQAAASGDLDDENVVWDGMPLHRSCDKDTITINQCARVVWKKADDEMKALYAEQLQYLRGTEAQFPPGRGASKQLIIAQLAWIAFRDKDCAYQLGEPGGSGDTFETLKCMYKRTLTRTAELREYTTCRYNGCPY